MSDEKRPKAAMESTKKVAPSRVEPGQGGRGGEPGARDQGKLGQLPLELVVDDGTGKQGDDQRRDHIQELTGHAPPPVDGLPCQGRGHWTALLHCARAFRCAVPARP